MQIYNFSCYICIILVFRGLSNTFMALNEGDNSHFGPWAVNPLLGPFRGRHPSTVQCHWCEPYSFYNILGVQYFAAQGQWINVLSGLEGRYNNSSSGENCGQTQTQKLSSTWKKLVSALALRFSCKQLLMLAGEENIRPCTGHLILEYTILALHCPAPEILNE